MSDLSPMSDARRQRIHTSIAPDATALNGDPRAPRCTAKPGGQRDHLRPERNTVRIDAARAGPRIEIAVSDEGPGIPEEDRSRVFERLQGRQIARPRPRRHRAGPGNRPAPGGRLARCAPNRAEDGARHRQPAGLSPRAPEHGLPGALCARVSSSVPQRVGECCCALYWFESGRRSPQRAPKNRSTS
jgi:hypothetical protein